MAGRNTLINSIIFDQPSASPGMEKTMDSPQTQDDDIQGDGDDRQAHRTYRFQNCGTVNVDSFNSRSDRRENCGNHAPRVTYHRPTINECEKSDLQGLDGPNLPTAIRQSNPSDVPLQTNHQSQVFPVQPPRSTSPPSCFSGDYNPKYLEQLLDSSVAAIAVVQISGKSLADVLTPRAYCNLSVLFKLAALDVPVPNTKPQMSDIPTRFNPDHYPYFDPLPSSCLAIPRDCKIHISMSVDDVFSWVGFAATISFLVFFINCIWERM